MKIPTLSNILVRSFLIFIIVWLWASYYLRGFFLILFVSVAITFAINYLISFLSKRKNQIKTTNKKHLEHMRQTMLQLKFMSKAQTLNLIKAALEHKFPCIVNQKKLTVRTTEQPLEIFTLFHKGGQPTESDIIDCIKAKSSSARALIIAESFPPALIVFARSIKVDIQLLDAAAVYNQILAPSETYPETVIEIKKSAKMSLRDLKNLAFNRTRTKSYIVTAVIILLSSLIIRYSIYYIIIATAVFILALSSYYSPIHSQNLFDK